MLVQAILIGLIAMFVTFEWMFGTNLGSRPIITGMLVGLVMGDLKTGIILGATLEMVFIGSITLGAAVPPDVITGGVLGAAFAISTGKGADVALARAFPCYCSCSRTHALRSSTRTRVQPPSLTTGKPSVFASA